MRYPSRSQREEAILGAGEDIPVRFKRRCPTWSSFRAAVPGHAILFAYVRNCAACHVVAEVSQSALDPAMLPCSLAIRTISAEISDIILARPGPRFSTWLHFPTGKDDEQILQWRKRSEHDGAALYQPIPSPLQPR